MSLVDEFTHEVADQQLQHQPLPASLKAIAYVFLVSGIANLIINAYNDITAAAADELHHFPGGTDIFHLSCLFVANRLLKREAVSQVTARALLVFFFIATFSNLVRVVLSVSRNGPAMLFGNIVPFGVVA